MVINKRNLAKEESQNRKKRPKLMTWGYALGEGAALYDEDEKIRERLIAEADLDRQLLEEEEDAAIERTIEMWGAQRVL